jgi:hypothetical protein
MGKYKEGVNAIEDAINGHIKEQKGNSSIVTGWIIIASVSDATSPRADGYVLQSSEALSHHGQVGLLQTAVDDKRNLGLMATIKAVMGDD